MKILIAAILLFSNAAMAQTAPMAAPTDAELKVLREKATPVLTKCVQCHTAAENGGFAEEYETKVIPLFNAQTKQADLTLLETAFAANPKSFLIASMIRRMKKDPKDEEYMPKQEGKNPKPLTDDELSAAVSYLEGVRAFYKPAN